MRYVRQRRAPRFVRAFDVPLRCWMFAWLFGLTTLAGAALETASNFAFATATNASLTEA